ncbi:septal ring lytic transglycosylase RlpA family protein [Hymenobacter sp. BT664]|uniref:Probable endolytic peptidoglycan transglycosylase RlpA n=1 Tax=Hymenobacter montanus TaxID=2771359 RepID=A0A927GK63_9BACT|nr:septal ring lytic transglycosylase RlpA family protein [Hymenobacter montanus]MBD2769227.1 septal ring lytic transglycosylase RlpA family protein [Hymenobacter montanus]
MLSVSAHATNPGTTKSASGPSTTTTVMRGRASWYGSYFQGRRTTSGERYDRFKYTCAHKTLPFGTRIRVTNVKNGKSVVVRVSDRGPYRHQRILDLSEIAARPLGITSCGAATVVAEVVPAETPLGLTTTPSNLAALYAADPNPDAAHTTYSAPDSTASAEPAEATLIEASRPSTTQAVAVAETVDCPKSFLIQAGSFLDAANAQSIQARIKSLLPELQVEVSQDLVDGRPHSRVLVGKFEDRAKAEATRKRLMVWGIGGLVREVALQ